MRTTLDVDDDVLEAVKSLANARNTTAGKIISELARHALMPPVAGKKERTRNGFVLFPTRKTGKPVTMELINRLRDQA